jgi:hypothetical protein
MVGRITRTAMGPKRKILELAAKVAEKYDCGTNSVEDALARTIAREIRALAVLDWSEVNWDRMKERAVGEPESIGEVTAEDTSDG